MFSYKFSRKSDNPLPTYGQKRCISHTASVCHEEFTNLNFVHSILAIVLINFSVQKFRQNLSISHWNIAI